MIGRRCTAVERVIVLDLGVNEWWGLCCLLIFFFFQAEDGIRDLTVTGVQTCALPIYWRDILDSVTVQWPDGRVSVSQRVATNQRVVLRQSHAVAPPAPSPQPLTPLFTDVTDRVKLPYVHRENDFVDFDREPLIPKLLSTEGPYSAVADVNGDGLDDLFIGGAKDQPGALLIQQPDGRFVSI